MNATARFERARSRFWSRVSIGRADECWTWTGATEPFGYGRFWFNGRTRTAQRVSWELTNGAIPAGFCVLHRCDNPPCVNLSHLFLGTKSDNSLDRHAKGRTSYGHTTPPERRARGERNHNAKLNADLVRVIRQKYRGGMTRVDIAAECGVHAGTVGRVLSGRAWAHVKAVA